MTLQDALGCTSQTVLAPSACCQQTIAFRGNKHKSWRAFMPRAAAMDAEALGLGRRQEGRVSWLPGRAAPAACLCCEGRRHFGGCCRPVLLWHAGGNMHKHVQAAVQARCRHTDYFA